LTSAAETGGARIEMCSTDDSMPPDSLNSPEFPLQLLPMSDDTAQLIQTGFEHHRSGRLREAESVYRTILERNPRHADALHLLGIMAHQTGNNKVAVELIEQAIESNPRIPDFYVNCGEVYRSLNQPELAIARLKQALELNPGLAGAHNNLGNIYLESGRFRQALECYGEAVRIHPDYAEAHNNLGIAHKELGQWELSIRSFMQAVKLNPGYSEAYNNQGNALRDSGRPDQAIDYYRKALDLNPGYAEVHSNYGNALRILGRMDEAIREYQRAISDKPGFAMAHYNLGIARDEMGQPEQAIGHYREALAINPDYPEALNNMGNALLQVGRIPDAVDSFNRALELKPDYAEAYRHLSMVEPNFEHATRINELLLQGDSSDEDAMHFHYALGNIYHDSGNYQEAFANFSTANRLKRRNITYDAGEHARHVDRLITAYSRACFDHPPVTGSDSDLPVFIVGMPRSGTTLVEQILSSHAAVHGAGELTPFTLIENRIIPRTNVPEHDVYRYPDQATADEIIAGYLAELRRHSDTALRITDKVPDNFLALGLIRLLFPRARIIHCRRDPMDTCLSIFMNYFVNTTGNLYTYDLEEIGCYYRDYLRLMAHWRELFPSSIIEIEYEELVGNQEEITRRLVACLGLEWDDHCLQFQDNRRVVKTASSAQVRKPMYTGSVNRWRRYQRQLVPIARILGYQPDGTA